MINFLNHKERIDVYQQRPTAYSRDDYSAAVIANRKGAPFTQAPVPSKHPTAEKRVPVTSF